MGEYMENDDIVLTSDRKDMRDSRHDPYHFETYTAEFGKKPKYPMYQATHYYNQNNGYWATANGKYATILGGRTLQWGDFSPQSFEYTNGVQTSHTGTPWSSSCWRTHAHNKNSDSRANYGYASKARFSNNWSDNWANQTAAHSAGNYYAYNKNSNASYGFSGDIRQYTQGWGLPYTVVNSSTNVKHGWVGNHTRTIFASDSQKNYRLDRSSSNISTAQNTNSSAWLHHDGCSFHRVTKSGTSTSATGGNYITAINDDLAKASISTCMDCHSSSEVYALQMSKASMPGNYWWSQTSGTSSGTVGALNRHMASGVDRGSAHDDDDETSNNGTL
jgi:hypothetical protein